MKCERGSTTQECMMSSVHSHLGLLAKWPCQKSHRMVKRRAVKVELEDGVADVPGLQSLGKGTATTSLRCSCCGSSPKECKTSLCLEEAYAPRCTQYLIKGLPHVS